MSLQECPGCHRHVRTTEEACPFCSRAIALRPRKALGRMALGGVVVVSTLAGCPIYGTPASYPPGPTPSFQGVPAFPSCAIESNAVDLLAQEPLAALVPAQIATDPPGTIVTGISGKDPYAPKLAIDRDATRVASANANGLSVSTGAADIKQLVADVQVNELVFAADGASIIFSDVEKSGPCPDPAHCMPAPGPFYNLKRVDVATQKLTTLVQHVRDLRDLKVAPRGGLVSFISRPTALANGDGAEAVLQLYHPDTGAITVPARLFPNGRYGWSPDGQTLALVDGDSATSDPASTIFTIATDGTDFKTLGKNAETSARGPFFSADGKSVRMVFLYNQASLAVQELHLDKSADRAFRVQLSEKWSYGDWFSSPDGTRFLALSGLPVCQRGITSFVLDSSGPVQYFPNATFRGWLGADARFLCSAAARNAVEQYYVARPSL
jgi:hypothetical protein